MNIPSELRMLQKPLLNGFGGREKAFLESLWGRLVFAEVDTRDQPIYLHFAAASEGKGDRGLGTEASLLRVSHLLDEEQEAVGGVLGERDYNTVSHTRRRLSALRAEGVRRFGLPARNAEGHA